MSHDTIVETATSCNSSFSEQLEMQHPAMFPPTPTLGTSFNTLAGSPETEEDDEVRALKTTALRAVVKDDTVTLSKVLEGLPCGVWSQWRNKAGRDLVTLSQ